MPTSTASRGITAQAQVGSSTIGTEQIIDQDIGAIDIAANAVLDSEIGAHTTTKITVPTTQLSGTVSEAQVADNAVTLAKMAHGTDGNLITYDAAGAPAAVATGTSGNVLTSGGAGVAPTFSAVGVTNIFVPTFNDTGSWTAVTTNTGYVDMTATGTTSVTGSAFIPTNTISSIQFVYLATASAGDIVMEFNFSDLIDGTLTVDASTATFTEAGGNNVSDFLTVQTTAFNLNTQGRVWNMRAARNGDDGADTLAASIKGVGFLFNF